MRLFTPGPVQLPDVVAHAMSQSPLHHRSPEFLELSQRLWRGLGQVWQTEQPVMVLAGSGMCGIEAAMGSVHAPGQKVVVLNHGRFGGRIAEIGTLLGLEVVQVVQPWGEIIEVGDVLPVLNAHPDATAVWMVHSETSTGVTLNVEAIASGVRSYRADLLICVDAVSSMAIHELRMDAWGLDVVASGSQKGLLSPPGLACVALSEQAHKAMQSHQPRSYTMNLQTVLRAQQSGLFTWTPPVTLVAAMTAAVDLILRIGLDATWAHHRRLADLLRTGLQNRSLDLFGCANSNTLTCLKHHQASRIQQLLREDHNMMVADGQDHLAGTMIRIGTCGALAVPDIMDMLAALDDVLSKL
jgi:aspartate aminotransferase-like enzyme